MEVRRTRRSALLSLAGLVSLSLVDPAAAQDDEGDSQPVETVAVGPDGEPTFQPSEVLVEEGGTVRFEWESSGHTVTITSDSSDEWRGVPEPKDEGFVHEHEFTQSTAEYEFYCEPHESDGMTGSLVVYHGDPGTTQDDESSTETADSSASDAGGEDEGSSDDSLPGFGVGSGVVVLAGVAAWLRRRVSDE